MPATRLRTIALHVEEPTPRAFVWVLSEARADGPWQALQRANTPAARYRDAVAQGLLALQALADDLDTGPRTAVRRRAAETASPPAMPAYFGFGPVD